MNARFILVLAFCGAAVLAVVSRSGAAPAADPAVTTPATTRPGDAIKCVVPTPRTWNGPGYTQAFRVARQLGTTICLPDPIDWFQLEGKQPEQSKHHKDAQWQNYLMKQNGLDVFIQMDPYKERHGPIPRLPKGVSNTFGEPRLLEAFMADVLQRVQLYHPRFLCLAMEVNAYYEQHPEDFDHFVSLFHEARTRVRAVAPQTLVFVSFQYEQLLGIFGGQAGLPVHGPQWELFAKFEPQIDAIGISSYPMKSLSPPRFGSPADLPADYYARLGQHTHKPIVFAELGWASDGAFGGSPRNQADFIRRLPALLHGLFVPLLNWNFLYDAKGYGPVFESMGLLDAQGVPKPAFEAWRTIQLDHAAK